MTAARFERLLKRMVCDVCGGPPATSTPMERYDAYWCKPCDRWLEGQCANPKCEFCPGRPEKPSDVPIEQRISWEGESE